jgi:type VI secretion system protein ImpK
MDRIDQMTKDCFNALIQIRTLDPGSQPSPETMHQRLRSFIDQMVTRGGELGFPREDVQDIAFAIVALTDEVVLNTAGPVRNFWMTRTLQLQYFQINTAGQDFFQRLQAVRADLPRRVEVLRVYYLCMMFGFYGQYRVRGGEVELGQIIEQVEQDLARHRQTGPENLSPHGERPAEARARTRRDLPLVALSIGAVVLALGLWAGLRYSLGNDVDAVVQRVRTLNRPQQ